MSGRKCRRTGCQVEVRGRADKQYHSDACRKAASRAKASDTPNSRDKPLRMDSDSEAPSVPYGSVTVRASNRRCERCGEPFYNPKARRFCSYECAWKEA